MDTDNMDVDEVSNDPVVLKKLLEQARQEKEQERQEKEQERQEKEQALQREKQLLKIREKEEDEAAYRDAERHAWQQRRRDAHVSPEGWDTCCVIPEDHLENLLQTLLESRLILLRAPPGSGKTTMAETFGVYCASLGYPVYNVGLLPFKPAQHKDEDDYFRSYWGNQHNDVKLNTSFSAILNRARSRDAGDKPLILVLDEAQIWYGPVMKTFWGNLKDRPPGLLVFCFSAFGHAGDVGSIGTPIEFPKYLGFPQLQLSREQVEQVAQKIQSSRPYDCSISSLEVLEKIHASANGQARLIRQTLDIFAERDSPYVTKEAQIDFLHSQKYYQLVSNTRVFLRVDRMYQELEKSKITRAEFLNTLLETNKGSKPLRITDAEKRGIMVSFGVFYQDNKEKELLYILCPLAFDILLTQHLTGKLTPTDTRNSFELFLVTTIERMKREKLLGSSAVVDVAKLSEDFLQKEFYRAAVSVLSPDAQPPVMSYTIQTNAGVWNGKSKGNCDFFINSALRWAVELVFQGDKISEHVDRFDPRGGSYASLNHKNAAVIDFRVPPKLTLPSDERDLHQQLYWAVVYAEDFSTATIHFPPVLNEAKWVPRETKTIPLKDFQ